MGNSNHKQREKKTKKEDRNDLNNNSNITPTNNFNNTTNNNNWNYTTNSIPNNGTTQSPWKKSAEVEVTQGREEKGDQIMTEERRMFEQRLTETLCKEELREYYRLARQYNHMDYFKQVLHNYIVEAGDNISKHAEDKVEAIILLQENMNYATKFYFGNDEEVQKRVDDSFAFLFSTLPPTQGEHAVVLFLHLYLLEHYNGDLRLTSLKQICCRKIKASNIEYDCETTPTDLIQSIKLFGAVERAMVLAKNAGLAIFSTEYVRRAFSRIACNTYNFNNEKSMISLMFKVFGGENRNLLQITQFHKSIIESKRLMSQFPVPRANFDFHVNVFAMRAWEVKKPAVMHMTSIPDLLEELQPVADSFAEQHRSFREHNGKGRTKFYWQAHSSTLLLRATFLPSSPTFTVTFAQALILRAFGDGGELSVGKIAEITGLHDNDFLDATLAALAIGDQALIRKETREEETYYTFQPHNLDSSLFGSEVNYALLTEDILSTQEAQRVIARGVLQSTKLAVQACIVRTCKKYQRKSFKELEQIVSVQFSYAYCTGEVLQEVLDSLTEREYLRDIGGRVYEYIP